jgi:hypothetical protein
MTRFRYSSVLSAALAAAGFAGAAQAADVGVSIQFSQPGAYGRIDIGQYPQPELIAPQPLVIERLPPDRPPPEPVYLWVPPEHREHWAKYCRQYHACGHPVYFVNHDWYQRTVMARHERREEMRRDEGRHEGEHHDQGRHEGERHDDGRHDERDRGRDRD